MLVGFNSSLEGESSFTTVITLSKRVTSSLARVNPFSVHERYLLVSIQASNRAVCARLISFTPLVGRGSAQIGCSFPAGKRSHTPSSSALAFNSPAQEMAWS